MLTGIYLEGDGVGLDLFAANDPVLQGHLELGLQATGIYTGVRDQFVFIFSFLSTYWSFSGYLAILRTPLAERARQRVRANTAAFIVWSGRNY